MRRNNIGSSSTAPAPPTAQAGRPGMSAARAAAVARLKPELVPQLSFPTGYRFVPTDEELVDVYLRRKIERRPPPLDVVNEVDIMSWDPAKLVETYKRYGEKKWYFYTRREPSKTKKGKEPNRKVVVDGVEEGSWAATGSITPIVRTIGGQPAATTAPMDMVIGTKRILTYRSLRSSDNDKWSMHEYILAGNSELDQYVLCMIQLKQNYGAEKKGKAERARRKRQTKMMPAICEAGGVQQEIPPPQETTSDSFQGTDAPSSSSSSIQMNSFAADTEAAADAVTLYNLQPQPLSSSAELTMIEASDSGDLYACLRQFYQQSENGRIASGELLYQQCDSTTLSHCDNGGMMQAWTEDPAMSYNQQQETLPLSFLDEPMMITPDFSCDLWLHEFDQKDNGTSWLLEDANLSSEDANLSSEDVPSDGNLVDKFGQKDIGASWLLENANLSSKGDGRNLEDHGQNQLCNQRNSGVLIGGGLEDGTLMSAQKKADCDDAAGQFVPSEHVPIEYMGDDDAGTYFSDVLELLDDTSDDHPQGDGCGDSVGNPEGSNQASFICQDGLQQPCKENTVLTVDCAVQEPTAEDACQSET